MLEKEMETLVNYILALFPEKFVERQNVPATPMSDTFYVRHQLTQPQLETAARSKISRVWEVLYVGTSTQDVMFTMDKLRSVFYQDALVTQLDASEFFMRVQWFNVGQSFVNENDQDMVIATLRTDVREPRIFPDSTLIQDVKIRKND